jgi:3'(2'),5'-bisphosphate nucleotidase
MSYSIGDTRVEVDEIVEIAKQAGLIIMEIYNQDTENWNVQDKSDNSPLTRADLAANEYICAKLREKYPSISIILEEIKNSEFEERKDWEAFFCVDPLDGTKEFLKRNGQFTVNIGLCHRNYPVMGVVNVPAMEPPTTYYGTNLVGAFKEDDADRYPVEIRCAEFSEDEANLSLVASLSHSNQATEDFIAKYKDPQLKSMGSSLKLLLVAEGEAHIYPRLAPTCEWDTCASQAIVEAAGGEVLQHEGNEGQEECEHGERVRYNKRNLLNPYFTVYGKRRGRGNPNPNPADFEVEEEKKSSSSSSRKSKKDEKSFGDFLPFIVALAGIAIYIGLKMSN